jgi:uncharacterized protein (DUF779 family)
MRDNSAALRYAGEQDGHLDILRKDSGGCCPGDAPTEGEHEKGEESDVEGVACHLARKVETPINIVTEH